MNKTSVPGSNSDTDDVSAALRLLAESLSGEVQRIHAEGAQAMQAGEDGTTQAVIESAKRLTAFRGKVDALRPDLQELEDSRAKATIEVQQIVGKRLFGRQTSGEITPQREYIRPILEVLVELGGRAPINDVLERVERKMKGVLKPKDFEIHESEPQHIRWQNTAQWARNTMANKDGRMKQKSTPRGTWEISDAGRAWLEMQPKQ